MCSILRGTRLLRVWGRHEGYTELSSGVFYLGVFSPRCQEKDGVWGRENPLAQGTAGTAGQGSGGSGRGARSSLTTYRSCRAHVGGLRAASREHAPAEGPRWCGTGRSRSRSRGPRRPSAGRCPHTGRRAGHGAAAPSRGGGSGARLRPLPARPDGAQLPRPGPGKLGCGRRGRAQQRPGLPVRKRPGGTGSARPPTARQASPPQPEARGTRPSPGSEAAAARRGHFVVAKRTNKRTNERTNERQQQKIKAEGLQPNHRPYKRRRAAPCEGIRPLSAAALPGACPPGRSGDRAVGAAPS